jgi:asparagine synthase (glutamine-hydrolysing)
VCGIAGWFGRVGTSTEQLETRCGAMLTAIAHRGPDDSGVWLDAALPLALGHRRLSVVELSAAGHQPMHSHDERFVIVFNGEIYNHVELRRRLDLSTQRAWRGHSDTETFLECICAWGLRAALEASVGMFAFALWDRHEKSLTLARDRMGEKPLYYGWQSGCFLFASEIKALRAHPAFDASCNWSAAAEFLRRNYVPSPHTIYEGIFKLPAATILTLPLQALKSGQPPDGEPQPYWSLADAAQRGAQSPFAGSYLEACDEIERLVVQAVKLQSVADVPVGAFLSGGVDSSLVVALMKTAATADVVTFSVGMSEAGLDESSYAQAVARHLGTRHIAHQLQPAEALAVIPQLPALWDEPLGDSSQIPTYVVSRIARQHVTVSLSGDGGDELFLGYAQYPIVASLWRTRALGHLPWNAALRALRLLPGSPAVAGYVRRAQVVVNAWRQPSAGRLARYWTDRYRQGPVPLVRQDEIRVAAMPELPDAAATAGLWDAGTYLPDDILVKVDRAAMANSLETRAPLLDHRLVELALSLPQDYKLHAGHQKRALKTVLYRYVPQSLVDRPKMGFALPMAHWLRSDLREWAQSLLDRIPAQSSPYDKRAIDAMWREHQSGRRDQTERLWGILSLLMFTSAP